MVEDDPAARRAITLILKAQGFDSAEAATVAEALGFLRKRPDWVLLDLMLPDGCGTAILRGVEPEYAATRVCVITGCGPEKVEEARRLRPRCVMTKPLNVGRLIELLGAGNAGRGVP